MGIVSLVKVPGKRGSHGGLSGSPRTILCVAVERSEAHLWTRHSCLPPGIGKALTFYQKVSPSRRGGAVGMESFLHSRCLDVGAPHALANVQLRGRSLHPLGGSPTESDILGPPLSVAAPDFGFICSRGPPLPAGRPCSLSPTGWSTSEPGDLSKTPGFV